MKKLFIFISIFTIAFFFTISEKTFAAKESTAIIDEYIKINSVKKINNGTGTIKVNYTVLKKVRTGINFTVGSTWDMYTNSRISKTASLKTKKGKYSVTLKTKSEFVGAQRVKLRAIVAGGQYRQGKEIKTFYKFPPTETTSHTVTKKEAIAQHFAIGAGIAVIKFAGSKLPFKVALKLADIGAAGATGVYTLKTLNVVGGYPSPAAGQYIKTTSSFSSKGLTIKMKMWTNKSSYKKGVKAIYSSSRTYKLGR